MGRLTRRGLLAAVAAGVLAGCTTDGDGPGGRGTGRVGDGSPTHTDGTPTATPALDLREANVVGATVESRGDRSYRFDVTLYHDDDGEDGYANWWQVETRDGERLGRRDLAHSHGTRRFTRSETVDVPGGVECVVVRGHDQTHAYGGRALLVALETGAVRAVDQGAEKQSMAGEACP
jgi:hypothetical protein